jgi:hypothetical protein
VSVAEDGAALDLTVTEAPWQDVFDNLEIDFGPTQYDHIYRRHSDFSRARRKRQDETTIEIPSDTPNNVTDVSFDLTSELLNYTFGADDFLAGLDSIVNLPSGPSLPIEIGCKNCSTRGQITLTQGTIKIDTKQIDLVPDIFEGGDDGKEIGSVITGGYMDLAVAGIGARLEMFARPVRSGSYEIALFPLPVLGFVIPGIGQAGASFEPRISADFEIDGELAVNYGIDVAVSSPRICLEGSQANSHQIPDGAGIRVQLGDLANTTISGIKGATLDALPFSSNVTDADIALSLAFTPTIPIGFEFSDKLSALVTVSLDLPRLDTKLTTGARNRCNLLVEDGKNRTKDTELSSLVLLESNISVAIDVAAELTLPLLPAPFDAAGTSANVFSTEIPLITSCVNPVRGAVKITKMAPMATIKADTAVAQALTSSACTKHAGDAACTCATVTTTVYAAIPTGDHDGLPPRETAPPLEMAPYYPSAPIDPMSHPGTLIETTTDGRRYEPTAQPSASTICTTSQTLRITMSKTSAPNTEAPTPPPIVVISAPGSKPCNSSTAETPATSTTAPATSVTTTSESQDRSSHSSSAISLTSESATSAETKSEATSTPSTTSPPKVEESKGFMAPPHSSTGTGDAATSTGPSEFTGAAMPGLVAPLVRREAGWQIAVLAVSVGFGVLFT